jgi:hypothetical protein
LAIVALFGIGLGEQALSAAASDMQTIVALLAFGFAFIHLALAVMLNRLPTTWTAPITNGKDVSDA